MEIITSRKDLVHEVAEVMQTDSGSLPFVNLTTQEIYIWRDPAVVGDDCMWPNVGDEV